VKFWGFNEPTLLKREVGVTPFSQNSAAPDLPPRVVNKAEKLTETPKRLKGQEKGNV